MRDDVEIKSGGGGEAGEIFRGYSDLAFDGGQYSAVRRISRETGDGAGGAVGGDDVSARMSALRRRYADVIGFVGYGFDGVIGGKSCAGGEGFLGEPVIEIGTHGHVDNGVRAGDGETQGWRRV